MRQLSNCFTDATTSEWAGICERENAPEVSEQCCWLALNLLIIYDICNRSSLINSCFIESKQQVILKFYK